jgi:O-antigen/teichoic acid export membrane protein
LSKNHESKVASQAFGRFFLNLGALTMAAQAVGFVSMVIKFRFFQAELMGVLGYFVAVSNLPPAFYENFSRLITRFVPTATPRHRAEILLVSFCCQLAILIAFGVIAIAAAGLFEGARFWHGHGIDPRLSYFMAGFVLAIVPINMLSSFFGACLNAWQRYQSLQVIDIVVLSINLLVTVFVVLTTTDLILGLKITTASTVLTALILLFIRFGMFWRISGIWGEMRELHPRTWPQAFRSVYHEGIRRYTSPMQLTGLFWYLSENLAVFVFARMGLMREAGIYSLVGRIYGVPRKFIPQLISVIFPRLVVSKERDEEAFRRKYVLLSWGKLGAHAVIGTVLLASYPLIVKIVNLPHDGTVLFLFAAFSFNLLLHAIVISNSNVIMLSTDTRWVLLTTGLRAIVISVVTFALVPTLKASGAAIALVISSVISMAMYVFETRREGTLSLGVNMRQFGAAVALASLWLAVIVAVLAWGG